MLLLFGVALLARVHCACSAVGDVHRFGSLIFEQRERERERERERDLSAISNWATYVVQI
jgi:hypothetical protein